MHRFIHFVNLLRKLFQNHAPGHVRDPLDALLLHLLFLVPLVVAAVLQTLLLLRIHVFHLAETPDVAAQLTHARDRFLGVFFVRPRGTRGVHPLVVVTAQSRFGEGGATPLAGAVFWGRCADAAFRSGGHSGSYGGGGGGGGGGGCRGGTGGGGGGGEAGE